MIDDQDRALADAGVRHPDPVHPVAGQQRVQDRRAGGQDRGPDRLHEMALDGLGGRLALEDVHRLGQPRAGQDEVERRLGDHLEQVGRRPADGHDLGRLGVRGIREERQRLGDHRLDLGRRAADRW